jgi:NADPH:quinone reductase-like Zn-dependent oxidoreductase
MKAVVIKKHGPPDGLQLKEVEKPIPGPNKVLIKIHATTVTSGDTVLRRLTFFQFLLMWPIARFFFGIRNQRKKILGHELAGEIEAVGRNVTKFRKGDRVFGTTGFKGGAYAEYICLPQDSVLERMPTNMTYKQAAAVPIGGICALYFLQKANIKSDQQVLIYGASGSIGSFAVQLAKTFGAHVTGVCSGKNLELVKSLGAETVIDYTTEDFVQDNKSYDLIFDTVGKISSAQCKPLLKRNGRFVSTHSSPVKEKSEHLVFLKEQIETGKIRPVIDRIYSLEAAAEAHRYVDTGHKKGNVVLTVEQ